MKRAGAIAILCTAAWTSTAGATGFTDVGEDLHPRERAEVVVDGAFRLRQEALYNLDLDRGPTPSGDPIFPVPADDPNGQWLRYGDMRLRTDVALYAPGGAVAVKTRVDVLDDVPLGGSPAGIPSASTTQTTALGDAFRLKRAYGEVKTPIGLLAAGRMGNQWGLGMLANGGDCADCDSGDAQDRLAFLTPLGGHIFAVAYDVSAIGPTAYRRDGVRRLGLAPSTAVQSITFAALRWRDAAAIERRANAGKSTFDYGAYVAHRWQKSDAPAEYLPLAAPQQGSSAQLMARGYRATAVDVWLRLAGPAYRIELEAAALFATVDQPSLIPGLLYNQSLYSRQLGAALESEFGAAVAPLGAGVDLGYASGDPSPGFGAFPSVGAAPAKPGDLDGSKANLPYRNRVDNFRFHPDYRIDRILFREIIGTVTGATYVRPHARWHLMRIATGTLTASIAAIASWATFAQSTPGGKTPLGLELDPTLSYASRDGFGVALEHAVLLPWSGFDNPALHLTARPAQLFRVRLMYTF